MQSILYVIKVMLMILFLVSYKKCLQLIISFRFACSLAELEQWR